MPRFVFPDSSPPSTPDRNSRNSSGYYQNDAEPSTTPAGPPPSSAASYTPVGAPSASYLGSSMMRGVTGSKPANFGNQSTGSSNRNLFGRGDSAGPLGRSIRGGKEREPSGLSREYSTGATVRDNRTGTFQMPSDDDEEDEEDGEEDGEGEDDEEYGVANGVRSGIGPFLDEDMGEDAEGEYEDMFLNLRHDAPYEERAGTEESDLLALATPAVTERIRKEAENIFRASTIARPGGLRSLEFKYASIAKDLYTQLGFAIINETPELILKTEDLINRLYDEGIGAQDDAEKLDTSLAGVASPLVTLWDQFAADLSQPEGEQAADIGPPPDSEPFQKAAYVAHLVLRLQHSRFENQLAEVNVPPLPETLFGWMRDNHNLYPEQLRDVMRHKPSPACHGLYWQTLCNSLIRGNVSGALQLLRNAGWELVRKGNRGDHAYTGKALENVQRAADITCEMLETCPGVKNNWDIWSSDWTLFKVQARGSQDRLTRFAEGKDRSQVDGDDPSMPRGRQSMVGLARKAESQVPWDIYQHLQNVYQIVLGDGNAILEIAQDWCEATIGLFGWWDEGRERNRKSLRMSQSLRMSGHLGTMESYPERLCAAFHAAVESDFHFNAASPVEVAIACAFEGNFTAVIGLLRFWSLPVACAVAEIGSLGHWLPAPETPNLIAMGSLDMEDLEVLGMNQKGADDLEGIKDTTLGFYARELAGIDQLSAERDGWELAIQVLGRMDSAARSEELVGELLRDLLATLDAQSEPTVDKIWRILNDLGMINYAEETAEVSEEDNK
jgi:hypothetical protein